MAGRSPCCPWIDKNLCKFLSTKKWWLGTESNRRHEDFQSSALPTELPSHLANNILIYERVPRRDSLKMAELTGLEPATSGVTDRRELQLHHSSK